MSSIQDTEAFIALCRAGVPRDQIAEQLGCSVDRVKRRHHWLHHTGRCPYPLAFRSFPGKRHISSLKGREDEIRGMFADGLGRLAIAKRLGVNPSLAAGFIDRHGLRPVHRKGRSRTGKLVSGYKITLPALNLRPLCDYGIDEADIMAGAEMARMMEYA